ncbi:hypothetical protein [Deinococcus marmoris]|uniref:hypothetical protein n=1 Tax=Deinococcus marmoris TaxID=249408 RepID=UPI0012DF6506|nr:hypothetical protein [Deinococcus marmoris]
MTTDTEREYHRLVEVGATPLDVAQVAHSHGMGVVEIMRLVRSLFQLEFAQAKDIGVQAVHGMGLSEYQEKYLLPLLEELEHQD